MKLLMSTDTLGGVWTYAIDLARALEAEGVEVVLACMGDRLTSDQLAQLKQLRTAKFFERQCRLEWMEDPWPDLQATAQWLLDVRDEVQPDLVHLNEYAHGPLNWRLPTLIVGHSCVLSWWRAVKRRDAPARFERYAEMVRQSLRGVDAVIAPSKAMAAALQTHYDSHMRVHVIPNGRSGSACADGLKRGFVFAAGRLWDEAKNLHALDVAAEHLPWPVYIAGSTTLAARDQLPQRASHAHLLGQLPARVVRTWMQRADIYALSARYEPFGLSVLEAAMAGCCLVLGDIESLRENWDGAAEFVNSDEPAELHSILRQLIDDNDKRIELARRAKRRSADYSSATMARSYLKHYEQLTAQVTRTAT